MKMQEIVQKWLDTIALPQIDGSATKGASRPQLPRQSWRCPRKSIARSGPRDSAIAFRTRSKSSSTSACRTRNGPRNRRRSSTSCRKLERSVVEMQKEKRGYLLTGDNSFVEAYKRATTDFLPAITAISPFWSPIRPEQSALLAEIRNGVERWITHFAAARKWKRNAPAET